MSDDDVIKSWLNIGSDSWNSPLQLPHPLQETPSSGWEREHQTPSFCTITNKKRNITRQTIHSVDGVMNKTKPMQNANDKNNQTYNCVTLGNNRFLMLFTSKTKRPIKLLSEVYLSHIIIYSNVHDVPLSMKKSSYLFAWNYFCLKFGGKYRLDLFLSKSTHACTRDKNILPLTLLDRFCDPWIVVVMYFVSFFV